MHTYLALLRGVNVGGKNMIKMAELKAALEAAGFQNVRTYIQSGNFIFNSNQADDAELARQIVACIATQFKLDVGAVVFSKQEWATIIKAAPKAWGHDPAWKHNLLILFKPYDMAATIAAVGKLKPEIEMMVAGKGVLYQSLSWDQFGKTTGGKLASNPIYKLMTVRNYNTSVKLLDLLNT